MDLMDIRGTDEPQVKEQDFFTLDMSSLPSPPTQLLNSPLLCNGGSYVVPQRC